jgi:signal transduction histidine kinase
VDRSDPWTLLKGFRWRLVRDGALTAVAGVCSFAFLEAVGHVVLAGDTLYEPVLAVYVLVPLGLSALVLGRRSVARALRVVADPDQDLGSPWHRPAAETAVTVAVSGLSFVAIELAARLVPGTHPDASLWGALGMVPPMTAVAGFLAVRAERRLRHLASRVREARGVWEPETRPVLARWMVQEAVLVVAAATAVFSAVEFSYYRFFARTTEYQPSLALGMILPMTLVVGVISYTFSRRTNRVLSRLTGGIAQVARGNFRLRLDEAQAGPFREVFRDFNTMARELGQVQVLRDDFINSFSHEFRTPITSIQGFAQLLLDVEVSEDERRQYLAIIAAESSRLSALAGRTLQLSKLQAQQTVDDANWFDLEEQLKQCVILLSASWTKKRLTVEVATEPVRCWASAELLQQVWINLLANAVQFTPEGGTVTVTLAPREAEAVVTVADTGCGLTAEQLPRIFAAYYQADPARSGGMGLGLSIVQRIVELSGGQIEVASTPGAGTTFTVRLPLTPES